MIDLFSSDLRPMEYWTMKAEDKLSQWERGIVEGRSTGFVTLNPFLRLINSELILIAARPSMGKTAMGMQIAEKVAEDMKKTGEGGVVAVFSAEMSGTELVVRMTGAHSGVNTHKLRNAQGSPTEYAKFRESARTLRNLPIWIDDGSAPTTKQMLSQLSKLMESMPIRLMLFDFLELGGDEGGTEELRISGILKNLKAIAKTLDIPVIALNQLNREVEKRASKMPMLSDLRASGMAEQLADKVVFIMRPEYYVERQEHIDVPEEDTKGIAYVLVAKNRNGPVGMVKMGFIKDRVMFTDLTRTPEPDTTRYQLNK